MEFYKDFLRIEKSKFKIILGILGILISIIWVIIKCRQNENLTLFDWIYIVFLGLSGVLNIIEGSGVLSSRLFGRAFIFINNDKISIKKSPFSKTDIIYWNEIGAINYKVNCFIFTSKNNFSMNLKLSKLDYSSIRKIKDMISEIAIKKNIDIN